MRNDFRTVLMAVVVLCGLCAGGVPAADDKTADFENRMAECVKDPTGVTADEMIAVLQISSELARPNAAANALRGYLAKHPVVEPRVLLFAARNAEQCGDFRAAAGRYKQYLRVADASAESSEAAARLYWILVGVLDAKAEAFQIMDESGVKFRMAVSARKYDLWFLQFAREQRLHAAVARRLAAIFAENLPLEMERVYYWEHLDWLMTEVGRGWQEHHAATVPCRALVPLIRESPDRSLQYAFYVANLAFRASAGGKSQDVLDKEYQPVLAAARAWFDARPSAARALNIFQMFSGAERYDPFFFTTLLDEKRALFIYIFGKLDTPNRNELYTWSREAPYNRLADRSAWTTLARTYPDYFRQNPAGALVGFDTSLTNIVDIRLLAQALNGVPNRDAAVINSLAAGDTLDACARHLFQKESWYLAPAEAYALWSTVARAFTPAGRGPAAVALSAAERERELRRIAIEVIAPSPLVLFSTNAAREVMTQVFRADPTNIYNKARVAEQLHILDWVPYTPDQRKAVYGEAYDEFKRWAAGIRKETEPRKGKGGVVVANTNRAAVEAVALVTPIDTVFQQVLQAAPANPGNAPTPLCASLARMLSSIQDRATNAYVTAARSVYAVVKDYPAQKTPFGEAVLVFLLQTPPGMDVIDLQCEVLADQLARYVPARNVRNVDMTVSSVLRSRPGWEPRNFPVSDSNVVLKINAVFAREFTRRLDAGQFHADLMEWFLGTRRGKQWVSSVTGIDLMTRLITQKTLLNNNWRPWGRTAAVNYCYLINREFLELQNLYPIESWFDDYFVEETLRTGYIDNGFWQFTRDKELKVAKAAAQVLQKYDKVPLGYGGTTGPVYDKTAYQEIVARAMGAAPEVRDAMLTAIEAMYGVSRFDEVAMGRFSLRWPSDDPAARLKFFAGLKKYLDRAAQAPVPVGVPSLQVPVAPGVLTVDEATMLARMFRVCIVPRWTVTDASGGLWNAISDALATGSRMAEMMEALPEFWRIVRDTDNRAGFRMLADRANALLDAGQAEVAASYSGIAEAMPRLNIPDDVRNQLRALHAKALSSVGGVIPVDRSDPRYPAFVAQADYLLGRFDTAWDRSKACADLLTATFKDLDLGFLVWVLERHTLAGNYERAETMAQKLIQWVDAAPQGFDPDIRAHLQVAYADIALARREYPLARAQYERVSAAADFDNTRYKYIAVLRVTDVDRLTHNYDRALQTLEKLAARKDPVIQAQCFYQMALIKFEQEQYTDSRTQLDQVFNLDPSHADGRILEGQLYLKLKKLMEATTVKVGLSADRQSIVPGRPLEIELNDRNLAVVGKASDVEVRVWTDAGDEETILLTPFGDSKTRFVGQLITAMGPIVKGDRLLQVLGRDNIRFDFSERFKRNNKINDSGTFPPIAVIADAELLASSGVILSREEQEKRALEQALRVQLAEVETKVAPDQAGTDVREADEIKPGNKINLRLTDLDMNVTSNRDVVEVRVTTSGGDSIDALKLTETGPYTGVFEGEAPSVPAPATAAASDSEESREPILAITAGDYPGWTGLADNQRPKWFMVDLNDRVELGRMEIIADTTGRKLKRFLVQTSGDGATFSTLGSWPDQLPSWDGSLFLEAVRGGARLSGVAAFQAYLDVGYKTGKGEKVRFCPASLKWAWKDQLAWSSDKMGLTRDGENSWFIMHYAGGFVLEKRMIKTLRLNVIAKTSLFESALVIDGEVAKPGPMAGSRQITTTLSKGAHRFDIYVKTQVAAEPRVELLQDVPTPPFMAVCPESMFTLSNNPTIGASLGFKPVEITTNSDGGIFTVEFTNTVARVVRLWLNDFETDAPAIRRLTLNDAQGKPVLPTRQDLVELRRNDMLELVPGDKITISYNDARCMNKARQFLETTLKATYHNGDISAFFVDSVLDQQGNRTPTFIPLRRYKPGDAISVQIHDPDLDVSPKADPAIFTMRATDGKPVTMQVSETNAHAAVFVGKIFPVSGVPTRPSEIQVRPGDDLILTYRDQENTQPGIPWDRSYIVEQTVDVIPELRIFESASYQLPAAEQVLQPSGSSVSIDNDFVPITRSITMTRPADPTGTSTVSGLFGVPLVVELTYPTIAQSPLSRATVYLQTGSARARASIPADAPFDPALPGTVAVYASPSGLGKVTMPAGYRDMLVRGNPELRSPLEDGRFTFMVRMALDLPAGKTPEAGVPQEDVNTTLVVKGGDTVHVAFRYMAGSNTTNWISAELQVTNDIIFAVMDRRYQKQVTSTHIGDKLFFRLVDQSKDVTDTKDSATIDVRAMSGATQTVSLVETLPHTGVFKGSIQLVFAEDAVQQSLPGTLAVRYGDEVTVTYGAVSSAVHVLLGSAGGTAAFSKRFKDPEIAVQTQFTIAEAYFEMAKKHRELDQEALARREIAQGRKLLEEAIRDYPDSEHKSHADYLLAELSLELGNESANADQKKRQYTEAIVRFSDIVTSYPESAQAPKAQYKKALTYEKLGDFDRACEEYVKLSYRYPDNELVAETIARLGQYFVKKGKEMADKAEAAPTTLEGKIIKLQALEMYKTAAQVFGRLAARFPDNRLAGKTIVLSGQCYLKAEDLPRAVEVFRKVADDKKAEPDLIAEALYWCGDSYVKMNQGPEAYRMFKRLTWDYPEGKWAKFARARLTEPQFADIEKKDSVTQ